jgi:hypothetical protein
MQSCPRLTRGSGLKKPSSSSLRERDEFIRCEYNNKQYDPYIQPHHCLKLQHYQKTTRYLYLSPCSFLPCGSRLFLIPKRVFETASLAPIIGFNTAIGTALTTALSGPCSSTPSTFFFFDSDCDSHYHPTSRTLPSVPPI